MRYKKLKTLIAKQSTMERNNAMRKALERKAKKAKSTAKDAQEILRKHFSEITTREFIRNVKKYCPELLPDERS